MASPTTLGDAVASASNELRTLALIAHNPGIWEYAARTADRSGSVIDGYSPATCAVFEFVSDWNEFCAAPKRLLVQRSG